MRKSRFIEGTVVWIEYSKDDCKWECLVDVGEIYEVLCPVKENQFNIGDHIEVQITDVTDSGIYGLVKEN